MTLLVALVAVVAAGCGSDDPESLANTLTATGDETSSSQTIADTSAAGSKETPGVNEISGADAKPGAPVTVSSRTPKEFAKAHCAQPIVVVLHQPGAILDKALFEAAKSAVAKAHVKDLVFLDYAPSEVKAMGDLPSKLGLLSAPGVATVGRDGTIENFWTTYVDDALIARSIQNADAAKACKVSTKDVPTAGTTSPLADAATVANGGTVSNTTTDPLAGTPPNTPTVDAAADPNGGVTLEQANPAPGKPIVPATTSSPTA